MDFLIASVVVSPFAAVYFFLENRLNLGGTVRIVIGSLLAGMGMAAAPHDVTEKGILFALGLIIALRGAAYLASQSLQSEHSKLAKAEVK